jgi:four helix bundle protein
MNYAESQNAESSKDFIHKLRIALKELREASVCLSIIEEAKLCSDIEVLSVLQSECHELTAILVSSINTVLRNSNPTSSKIN